MRYNPLGVYCMLRNACVIAAFVLSGFVVWLFLQIPREAF